jgi:hypothetical protein
VPLAAHDLGSREVVRRQTAEDAHGHLLWQPPAKEAQRLLHALLLPSLLFLSPLIKLRSFLVVVALPQPAQHDVN